MRIPQVKIYLTYLMKEVTHPTVYIFAGIIGTTICLLTSAFSWIPYLVPLFVQMTVRSSVKFRLRHRDALVELPAQKEDPVFIMDGEGQIILCVGKTRDLFDQYHVLNIKGFISDEAFERILASTDACTLREPVGVEVFSGKTLKWYEVRASCAASTHGETSRRILVWFQDISLRQIYYLRLKDLLRYSDSHIASLEKEGSPPHSAFRHLAIFLLKEYQGVFISRADPSGRLTGYAYRVKDHQILRSDPIGIPGDSPDPVCRARSTSRVITDTVRNREGLTAFSQTYPFSPEMMDFLGLEVKNFITCSEADVSVTAFNFRGEITVHEREFFKVVANIFKTMTMIADLRIGPGAEKPESRAASGSR